MVNYKYLTRFKVGNHWIDKIFDTMKEAKEEGLKEIDKVKSPYCSFEIIKIESKQI